MAAVRAMSETVQLVGIDLGTTTMSAVVAEAHLRKEELRAIPSVRTGQATYTGTF